MLTGKRLTPSVHTRHKISATVLLAAMFAMLPASVLAESPRLILQITVDALRGDLHRRFADLLGDGGFRYLTENGIDYRNAHYQHANTETIVGHTSLATGAVPAAHGMVANVWFDREQDRLVYNIEDVDYRLLTAGADVDQKNRDRSYAENRPLGWSIAKQHPDLDLQ